MPDIADVAWSERDDRNSEAVPDGWPQGTMPAYVDETGRMMMGAIKRFWNKINPIYQTSGTGDDYIVQTEVGVDQINLYELLCVRIDRSNTGTTPTLQFGATNSRTIVKAGPSGYIPLTAGDLFAGNSHTFWYNGAFYILTDPATPFGGPFQPFSANLTAWSAVNPSSYSTTAQIAATYLPLAGGTLTGGLITAASTTGAAGLNIPAGNAPTAPAAGDFWAQGNTLKFRTAGAFTGTVAFLDVSQIWTICQVFAASTTSLPGIRLPHGVAPTAPTNGDFWTTTSGLFCRVNGATQQYLFLGGALGTPLSGTATNLTGLPLTTGVTGTLGIGNGGTGQVTPAAAFDALAPTTTRGDLVFRNATTNARLAASTAGYHLQTNGAGTDPTWVGFLQSGTGAATRTWNSKAAEALSPYDFGAVGDGVADDTTALNNWFTQVAIVGSGQLGTGTFRVTANVTWSCPRNCPKITGNGSSYSKIAFDNGFGLTIQGIGGANTVFFGRFADFSVIGNIAGVLVKVANGASDAFNGVPFDSIVVNNNSTNAANKGVQFNALYSSKVFMTVNCSGSGNGTAMELVAGSMNTIKAICGQANVGLHLTSTGSAVAGNFFDAVDIEVCATCVLIDNASVQDNTFVGGVISFNAVGNVGIDATAGVANEFRNMNYGGSGTLFHATVATHRKGFNWVNRVQNVVSTPGVPASGTAVVNTNGQSALVNISGGTLTNIVVNGISIAVTTPATVIVDNDTSITLTYTVAPTWRWMPSNI